MLSAMSCLLLEYADIQEAFYVLDKRRASVPRKISTFLTTDTGATDLEHELGREERPQLGLASRKTKEEICHTIDEYKGK